MSSCPSPHRCPGAANDDVNEVAGSLPIEVAQGRWRELQNVTQHTCTLQLRLAITPEDFNQQRGLIEQSLSHLYHEHVTITLQAGSVIVNVVAVLSSPLSLASFRTRAAELTDADLTDELQLDVSTVSQLDVETQTVQVPFDVACPAGFYCSAAAYYACPRGTYNNLTGQHDSSKCNACPTPERMTTLNEGSPSVEACVCIASYYQGPDGSCLKCPVGSDCTEPGMALSFLPVRLGYFRPSNASVDIRRCPDAGENCNGRDSCDHSNSGCRGTLNGSLPCEPTLTGILCLSCEDEKRFYVAASGSEVAHCEECRDTLGASLALVAGALVSVLLLWALPYALSKDVKETIRNAHKKLRLDNKAKIIVGFYMIATQVSSVYEVRLPQDVQQLLHSMTVVITVGIELGLRATPLACLGLHGYMPQLLFWMITPLLLVGLIIIWAALSMAWKPEGNHEAPWSRAILLKATPYALRLLFLVYPVVTQEAFKAFSCYTLDAGSLNTRRWLRADVSMECGSNEHASAQMAASLAILMYPVGLMALFMALLYNAQSAIISKKPTKLSSALGFLYLEFKERCFWWGE